MLAHTKKRPTDDGLVSLQFRVHPANADNVLLEAETADSRQLRWWLRGFGDDVEVLEPAELRKEFAEMAKKLAGIYGGEP